jgi:MarR family transcriptional regulator, organic hydroperoxide resistance regulator
MTTRTRTQSDALLSLALASHSLASAPNEDPVPNTVRDVHRAYTRALQETFNEYGIGIGQWFFLRALWEEDGITQRQLSQRVGTMEPTTVTALNCLEERDLVRRVRNKQDRRKVNIYLTERGQELRSVLLPRAEGVHKHALAGITPQEVTEAILVLRRISENLRARTVSDSWDMLDNNL